MGKMRNGNCGMMAIGPQVGPRDRRYSAVYRTPRVAGAAVNCVMRMWKVAFVHVTVILICHLKNKGQLRVMRFLFLILHAIFKCSQWSAEAESDL